MLAVPDDGPPLGLVRSDDSEWQLVAEQAPDEHTYHFGFSIVGVGLSSFSLFSVADVDEDGASGFEMLEEMGERSVGDWVCIVESFLVEGGGGELADQRGHPVLDVEEVGLYARFQEPFEEWPVEEGHVGVGADAGRGELAGIAD